MRANLTLIASDCYWCIGSFTDFSCFLIFALMHKEAACQCNQTLATVNNDNKRTTTHMSSSFDKLHPTYSRVTGSIGLVTRLLVNCHNRGLTRFVWSRQPLSTAARTTGSQSSSVCKCAFGGGMCVCVCICWVEVQQGRGVSCLSIFRPDWSEWVATLLLSWIPPSLFFFEFSVWRQIDISVQLETWHHHGPDACLRVKDIHHCLTIRQKGNIFHKCNIDYKVTGKAHAFLPDQFQIVLDASRQ